MQVGRLLSDPRSTGLGLLLLSWIELVADSYAEALEYSEQALAVAVTPFDRLFAIDGKGCSLVLLRQIGAGAKLIEEHRRTCIADGYLFALNGSDGILGVCKVLEGNIREGINFLEEAILRREKEGYRSAAGWYRLFISEVYLQIIAGKEKLSLPNLLKNLPIIVKVMVTASSRISALMTEVMEYPHFDPKGHHAGHAQMILGLLYRIKKKRSLALEHLTAAKRILSQFGPAPILARVDAALAELGQ
jgi:tetratricopeptide (TPR) repeat protein